MVERTGAEIEAWLQQEVQAVHWRGGRWTLCGGLGNTFARATEFVTCAACRDRLDSVTVGADREPPWWHDYHRLAEKVAAYEPALLRLGGPDALRDALLAEGDSGAGD